MQTKTLLKWALIILLFTIAIKTRLNLFDQEGGDQRTYKQTVQEFSQGINPYVYTVKSFENPKYHEHGYAYLPSLLYVQSFFYNLNAKYNLDQPLHYLWKIPVLLSDIGVGILLIKISNKKGPVPLLFVLTYWFFNPYFIVIKQYTLYDPLSIFFMFLAVYYLDKNSYVSGFSYAVAISFKTFPIILFPIFLMLTKNKLKFLTSGFIVAFLISIPFMTTFYDFTAYVKGSLLVHGERSIQGRPILPTIGFYLNTLKITSQKIDYFLQSKSTIFSYAALIFGWFTPVVLYLKNKMKDKYVLTTISFLAYYTFSPVLSRTHILWFLPLFLVGTYTFFEQKNKKYLFYITVCAFYLVTAGYLHIWDKGFRVSDTPHGIYVTL